MTLADLQPFVFGFLLVFARVGSALMLMPALGEAMIPATVRLSLGLVLSVAVYPIVRTTLPVEPAQPLALIPVVATEIATGLIIGAIARFLMMALQIAGSLMAVQSGLAFAMSYDPTQGQQSALVGNFLTLMATATIFATDLHHVLIAGLVGSYQTLPPGALPPAEDVARLGTELVAQAFLLGIQVGAPFLIYGLVFNVALGVLNRLMPTLQVFFVALPVQVASTIALFMIALPLAMTWFMNHLQGRMEQFIR